ncbi:MAG: hypothetical protein AAGI69_07735 [Cyanobacteria bacterium P01_H01_bin.21]
MKITDLDSMTDIDKVSNDLQGSGTTFTEAYTVTEVNYGVAFADAGAFSFGENTFTTAHTTAYAAKSERNTNFLTKTTFKGVAYAGATAIAVDDGVSISTSKSYSEYTHKGYYISAGF